MGGEKEGINQGLSAAVFMLRAGSGGRGIGGGEGGDTGWREGVTRCREGEVTSRADR